MSLERKPLSPAHTFHRLSDHRIVVSDGWRTDVCKHRLDGPALIITDEGMVWFINNRRHRLDGPASIWSSGQVRWSVCP